MWKTTFLILKTFTITYQDIFVEELDDNMGRVSLNILWLATDLNIIQDQGGIPERRHCLLNYFSTAGAVTKDHTSIRVWKETFYNKSRR